jgi:hypothetical protein
VAFNEELKSRIWFVENSKSNLGRTVTETLVEITSRIARRDASRAEATLQADIRSFILQAELNVHANQLSSVGDEVAMESQLGSGTLNRIDIEAGTTVIEVKRNLRQGNTLAVAEDQLGRYVSNRCDQTGARYLGVLTDGHEWRLYVPDPENSGRILLTGEPLLIRGGADTESLQRWLGTVLATVEQIRPTPDAIASRLGAESPAHQADHTTLHALYEAGKFDPTVALKRELWGKLLKTAFGEGFEDVDVDHLFIDHTLLVLTAEAIAHAVIGFDLRNDGTLTPQVLAGGAKFQEARIFGVVEADFFDWPLEVAGGEHFIRSLAERIGRFDWSRVDHDVLKHLYESVISQQTREALGEYYTPDWLADRVVAETYSEPLETRVMDASAGSGTFLFHAARAYLESAEAAGQNSGQAVNGLVRHVFGMDIHPVAVTLARVTYLLAIGRERLNATNRGPISIPVYLGDSIQWEQQRDLLSKEGAITVQTTGEDIMSAGGGLLFDDALVFPHSVLQDAQRFDRLVSDMANRVLTSATTAPAPGAKSRSQREATSSVRRLIDPILTRHEVPEEDRDCLRTTFTTMRQLHLNGRNHIWGYYVRNLIRPIWFSQEENRVDLLVGNPPWLRYSKMGSTMQGRYKALGKERNLLASRAGAAARDLSTLFVSRAVELYLKGGGRFAYVMPHGTLTRKPHHGFRSGKWSSNSRSSSFLAVSFEQAWDLIKIPTGFPMTSCVIFGTRTDPIGGELPSTVRSWEGRFSKPSLTWAEVEDRVTVSEKAIVQHDPADPSPQSPYRTQFRAGAILYPRMLMCVEEAEEGPLGSGAGRKAVVSRRGNLDNPPWKNLPSITARVGSEYLFPVLLGETVAPYRLLSPLTAVLPIAGGELLASEKVAEHEDLSTWWDQAEGLWASNRVASETSALAERIDYHGQLSAQLGKTFPYRVCYTSSGNRLAAVTVTDERVVVEHSLYWAAVETQSEARYLTAILNSNALLDRVRPLQSLGLFGARHFDKYVFKIPFGRYDRSNSDHVRLVNLTKAAESVAAAADISAAKRFQDARKIIDGDLKSSGVADEIEQLVDSILPVVAAEALED